MGLRSTVLLAASAALLLAALAACGSRADYELVQLREHVRHGDHAALRAQHARLSEAQRALPAVRELALAAELEAAGLSSVDLVLVLPQRLTRLPSVARELPADLLGAGQRAVLRDLALEGLDSPAPSGALARRLEVATLVLIGLLEHRDGRPAGLDLCLRGLDEMAREEDAAGLAAAAVLAELEELTSVWVEAGLGSPDPRRDLLAQYLEDGP